MTKEKKNENKNKTRRTVPGIRERDARRVWTLFLRRLLEKVSSSSSRIVSQRILLKFALFFQLQYLCLSWSSSASTTSSSCCRLCHAKNHPPSSSCLLFLSFFLRHISFFPPAASEIPFSPLRSLLLLLEMSPGRMFWRQEVYGNHNLYSWCSSSSSFFFLSCLLHRLFFVLSSLLSISTQSFLFLS